MKILLQNEKYHAKNYKAALEETFVELDYLPIEMSCCLLINDEGIELLKNIELTLLNTK